MLLLFFLAFLLLCHNSINSRQAVSAIAAQVYFDGEYRIGNGPWLKITEDQHISSTKGGVTLRGNFHMLAPDGEYVGIYSGDIPVAFYTNHIGVTIFEGENEPVILDTENPLFGSSACGEYWNAHLLTIGREDPVEIRIRNPHRFGNENAIDEMLSKVRCCAGSGSYRGAKPQKSTTRDYAYQHNLKKECVI